MIYYSNKARKSAIREIERLNIKIGMIPGKFLSYTESRTISKFLNILKNEIEKENKLENRKIGGTKKMTNTEREFKTTIKEYAKELDAIFEEYGDKMNDTLKEIVEYCERERETASALGVDEYKPFGIDLDDYQELPDSIEYYCNGAEEAYEEYFERGIAGEEINEEERFEVLNKIGKHNNEYRNQILENIEKFLKHKEQNDAGKSPEEIEKIKMAEILCSSPAWNGTIKEPQTLCEYLTYEEMKDAYELLDEAEEELAEGR